MRVLIVTEVFYPENFLINDFASELVRRGYEVEVMTRQPSYPEGRVYAGYRNDSYSQSVWEGVTIHRFRTIEGYRESKLKKIWNYVHYVRAGSRLIEKICRRADVILVHQTGPLTVALPAIHARGLYGIPVVVWTFDIWPDAVYAYGFPKLPPLPSLLGHIMRKVYRNADAILVSSERFADTIRRYSGPRDVVYAPNWLIESPEEPSSLCFEQGRLHFTFTGNVSVAQNLDNVIRGFALASLPDAQLHIVGDGSSLSRHKHLAGELGLTRVLFHGRLPYSQMQSVLRQSDVLVLPLVSSAGIDKTEPFKLQSYLKSGKPVLGVIGGAGRELIERYGLGCCCNPDSPQDIAEGFRRISRLTADEKERIALASSRLMRARYDRETILRRVEEVLCHVMKR